MIALCLCDFCTQYGMGMAVACRWAVATDGLGAVLPHVGSLFLLGYFPPRAFTLPRWGETFPPMAWVCLPTGFGLPHRGVATTGSGLAPRCRCFRCGVVCPRGVSLGTLGAVLPHWGLPLGIAHRGVALQDFWLSHQGGRLPPIGFCHLGDTLPHVAVGFAVGVLAPVGFPLATLGAVLPPFCHSLPTPTVGVVAYVG